MTYGDNFLLDVHPQLSNLKYFFHFKNGIAFPKHEPHGRLLLKIRLIRNIIFLIKFELNLHCD